MLCYRQAPIGDDNYLHVAGGGVVSGGVMLSVAGATSGWRRPPEPPPPPYLPMSPDYVPMRPPPLPLPLSCSEYELMSDFAGVARRDRPPAPPPRPPAASPSAPAAPDSLDELRQEAYCVLHVGEAGEGETEAAVGEFSRTCPQRQSAPRSPRAASRLRASSSTSDVHTATPSRPLAERLTPFFLKRKPKPPPPAPAPPPAAPSRVDSSTVASLRFLSLHRFGGAPEHPLPAPLLTAAASDLRL